MNVPTRFVPPVKYNAPSFMGGVPNILCILDKIRSGFYWCVDKNEQSSRGALVADVNCSRVGVSASLDECQHQSLSTGVKGCVVVGGFEQTTHGGHELQFMLEDISDSFKSIT